VAAPAGEHKREAECAGEIGADSQYLVATNAGDEAAGQNGAESIADNDGDQAGGGKGDGFVGRDWEIDGDGIEELIATGNMSVDICIFSSSF
jgi:hypothetical protein